MHCGMVTGFLKEQRSPFGRYAWLKQASFLEISNICTLFSSEAVFTTDAMYVRFETLANVAHFPFTRSQNPYSLVILPVLNLLYWFVTWSWGRDLNKSLGRRNLHSPQQQLCDAGIFHRLYPRLLYERSWKVAVKVRQISALKVLKRLVCVGFEVFMTYTHALFWVTEVCVRVF